MAECKLIRGEAAFHGKQGLDYLAGVSAETTGARAICMHLLEIPPGASAEPHYHEAHETAILVLEGAAEMRHGPNLELAMQMEAVTSCTSRQAPLISLTTRPQRSCAPSSPAPTRTSKKASSYSRGLPTSTPTVRRRPRINVGRRGFRPRNRPRIIHR